MAASTGQHIMNPDGLSTKSCFNFLLNLKQPPRATNVGFFFNYDVNMMLRDIPVSKLKKLWSEKYLYWRGFEIEWTPTKCVEIKRESPSGKVTVYDVGGFFQSSFVTALK